MSASRELLKRLLIVEDCDELRRTLASALSERASEIRGVANVSEAESLVRSWCPDLVVLDFALPDGDAFDVLRVIAGTEPTPLVVVISGVSGSRDSFLLAQLGVRAFVPKPMTLESLERACDEASTSAPDLTPLLRTTVGRQSVHQVEEKVRATMVSEALARSGGNLSFAARMLKVSRQLLQHIMKRG